MNKADRQARAEALILRLLAEAGPRGMRRTAITEALPHDWSFSTRILDEMASDGRIVMINRFYLSPGLEDEHRELQRNLQRAREIRALQRNKGVKVEVVIDGTPTGWIVKVPLWMANRQVDLCAPSSMPTPEPEAEPTPEPVNFWATPPETIPAGKPALVLVRDDEKPVPVPAQPFAWQPYVSADSAAHTAVMVLPVVGDEPHTSEDFWA